MGRATEWGSPQTIWQSDVHKCPCQIQHDLRIHYGLRIHFDLSSDNMFTYIYIYIYLFIYSCMYRYIYICICIRIERYNTACVQTGYPQTWSWCNAEHGTQQGHGFLWKSGHHRVPPNSSWIDSIWARHQLQAGHGLVNWRFFIRWMLVVVHELVILARVEICWHWQ